MSKYDRHKKKVDDYIYPHKHCKKCGQLIEEAYTYCPNCYEKLKQKKERKWYSRIFKRKKASDTNSSD